MHILTFTFGILHLSCLLSLQGKKRAAKPEHAERGTLTRSEFVFSDARNMSTSVFTVGWSSDTRTQQTLCLEIEDIYRVL
ncbi:uncharacterized protein EV420DRAFT_1574483, partial [Desarmillaria tabescens]